jgi:hypothetical protein
MLACMELDPVVLGHYQRFARRAPEFFALQRYNRPDFPDWNPKERPLQTIKLANGIEVDLDLDSGNDKRDFRTKVIYPVGFRVEVASHFLEHMLTLQPGIGHMEQNRRRSFNDLRYNGSTRYDYTDFWVGFSPRYMRNIVGNGFNPFEAAGAIVFGMAVNPDITVTHFEREKERVRAEVLRNEGDPERRMTDFVVPLLLGGKDYTFPHADAQVAFSRDELIAILQNRPHGNVRFEVEGNPMKDDAKNGIGQALDNLFGKLPVGEVRTPAGVFSPLMEDPRIQVATAYDLRIGYGGIYQVMRWKNPAEGMSSVLFKGVLRRLNRDYLAKEGAFYKEDMTTLDLSRESMEINYQMFTTDNPERLFQVMDGISKRIFDDKQLASEYLEEERAAAIGHNFGSVDLDRVRLSRQIGLSLANNCSALCYLLRDLTLDQVLEAGSKTNIRQLYYAPVTGTPLTDFTQVDEAELVRIWKS